jgi:hypothetical protein
LRARQHLVEAESRANHSLRCRALAHELALEWSPSANRVSSWAATNGRSG